VDVVDIERVLTGGGVMITSLFIGGVTKVVLAWKAKMATPTRIPVPTPSKMTVWRALIRAFWTPAG
jgi:hypothetical protein